MHWQINHLKQRYPHDKIKYEKLLLGDGEDRLFSLYVTSVQIGCYNKPVDIWSREDFEQFIGEKNVYFEDSDHLRQLLYQGKKYGFNDKYGTNKFLIFVNKIGYEINYGENTNIYSSSSIHNIWSKTNEIYPFAGINFANFINLVRALPKFREHKIFVKFFEEQQFRQYLYSRKFKTFTNLDDVEYDEIEKLKLRTIFCGINSIGRPKFLKLISNISSNRVFFVLPMRRKFLCGYSGFISNYNENILYSENNNFGEINLSRIFGNINIRMKTIFCEDIELYEATTVELLTKLTMTTEMRFDGFDVEELSEMEQVFFGNQNNTQGDRETHLRHLDVLRQFYIRSHQKFTSYLLGDQSIITDENYRINKRDHMHFIYNVNGGPGCGKTDRLTEIVRYYSEKNFKIGICANANEHVVNVGLKMIQYNMNFQYLFGKKAAQRGLPKELTNKTKKSRTLLCTVSMAFSRNRFKEIDILVIDEISRVTIGELTLFLSKYQQIKRIIFFGDKYQANIYNPQNFKTNWMKPVVDIVPEACTLYYNTTHRFGDKTVGALNQIAYKEKPLQSMKPKEKQRSEELLFKNTCDVACEEYVREIDDEKSYYNLRNIEFTIKFLNDKKNTEKWTIITPYKAQIEEYFKREINAFTIDAFQGRECDNIILDLVRCNERNSIGFISNTCRLVVALSRHRNKLHILGCKQTIKKTVFAELIQNGHIVLFDPFV